MPSNNDNSTGTYDVIILGAGGAGLMCASVAGTRGKRVLAIDHADEAGKKILISGGGRCNFTNIHTAANRYLSNNPHFVKSALGRYTAQDFIALVEKYNIAWHEKELGQLFCDGSAKQIVAMLLSECTKGDVAFAFGDEISEITHEDGRYHVTHGNKTTSAPALVVATGGASIPKMGASGFAYDLAEYFDLKVIEPRPGLVPLTLDDTDFKALSGLSCEVILHCGKVEFRGGMLFTHKGLSGPAILQISSWWRDGEAIDINFMPASNADWLIEAKRKHPRSTLRANLATVLPDRLAAVLAERIGYNGELANIADKKLQEAQQKLASWRIIPGGTEGFAKAEVTVGGIDTNELSSKTMEAKKQPGLYIIGEAVDVTGWLGGYNFQWAWASGQAAGGAV